MSGTLADQLRGRPVRRGTLAPWARALAGQGLPADIEMTVTAPRMPPQPMGMPPEPGPMPRPQMPLQALDDPSMPQAASMPPQQPAMPRQAPPMAPTGGLTADDLNALMLERLGLGAAPEARPGVDPRELENARMRIGAFGFGGYGGG